MSSIKDEIAVNRIMIIGILDALGMSEKQIMEYFDKAKEVNKQINEEIKKEEKKDE